MKRRALWIGGAAAVAAVGGLGTALWRDRPGPGPGAALWPLSFDRPDGQTLAIASFRGKPLLVNFWATWCPPCVGELPLLDRFSLGRQGWQVVGLAVDRVEPVRRFLELHPVSFAIGMAGLDGVDLARRLGNAAGGLPFSLVFGSDGDIAAVKLGAIDAMDLERWVADVK